MNKYQCNVCNHDEPCRFESTLELPVGTICPYGAQVYAEYEPITKRECQKCAQYSCEECCERALGERHE